MSKLYIVTLLIYFICRVHHAKMQGWMTHKLESSLPGEISTTSDMQMTPLQQQKVKKNKSLLMRVKEESEKSGLKFNIQRAKIMASSPISSWQIEGGEVEAVTNILFLGSKITADGDCSHEIKRCLSLEGNYDQPRQLFKSRDIILLTKVCVVKAMVFPIVMYRCESWTIKKSENQRADAFELWCWRRLLRVPWSARRSNQSILMVISNEYSLEGLILKLKLQYFGQNAEELTHWKKFQC